MAGNRSVHERQCTGLAQAKNLRSCSLVWFSKTRALPASGRRRCALWPPRPLARDDVAVDSSASALVIDKERDHSAFLGAASMLNVNVSIVAAAFMAVAG